MSLNPTHLMNYIHTKPKTLIEATRQVEGGIETLKLVFSWGNRGKKNYSIYVDFEIDGELEFDKLEWHSTKAKATKAFNALVKKHGFEKVKGGAK